MSLFGRSTKKTKKANGRPAPGDRADTGAFGGQQADFSADLDVHVCCICGAPLGFDREDEIDGEGPGRDICGECNRARNFDIEVGW